MDNYNENNAFDENNTFDDLDSNFTSESLDYKNKENDVDDKEYDDKEYDDKEYIDVIRYMIEAHIDLPNMKNESVRWFAYFVPELCIEITVMENFSNMVILNKEPLEVYKCDKPRNKYHINKFGIVNGSTCESKLEYIKADRQWVNDCYLFYKEEEKIKTLKNQLFLRAPVAKSNEKIAVEYFELGMQCFESHNFELGRNNFLKCLNMLDMSDSDELPEHYYLAKYNIACCYSREGNIQLALKWLHNAITDGYDNWAHTITDYDMAPLLNIQFATNDQISQFVNLIKIMMKNNPNRKISTPEIPKELNSVDIFLKQHNLESYENVKHAAKKIIKF